MNKHISRMLFLSAFAIAGMVGGTSCTDYLDKAPESDYGENDPYKNFTNFQGFVEELYDFIPLVSNNRDANHNCFNYGEDEYWEPTESRLFANDVDDGNFWGWQKQDTENVKYYGYPNMRGTLGGSLRDDRGNLWGMAWYGIRKANVGIAHLDQLTGATDEERNLIEGQLYFFRAWFHFMLMEWWGGMPYIDTELSADVSLTLPRLTWQECAEKCVADFDHAAGLLPGAYAEVSLLTAPRRGVLTLPLRAVTEEQGLHFVYIQEDADCYRRREVRLGQSDGERVEILAGLKPGERVVTAGAVHVRLAAASGAIPGHNHNH